MQPEIAIVIGDLGIYRARYPNLWGCLSPWLWLPSSTPSFLSDFPSNEKTRGRSAHKTNEKSFSHHKRPIFLHISSNPFPILFPWTKNPCDKSMWKTRRIFSALALGGDSAAPARLLHEALHPLRHRAAQVGL